MALSNYDPGQELSSIDFSGLIGGPLSAIVDAQAKSALSTVDFIKSVGFTEDTIDEDTGIVTPGKPIYVSFHYPKMVKPYQSSGERRVQNIEVESGGSGYSQDEILNVYGVNVTVKAVDGDGVIQELYPLSVEYSDSLPTEDLTGVSPTSTNGAGIEATFKVVTIPGTPAVPAEFQKMSIEVPLLTLMPIPYIRVEEGEIDFHAKITSMESAEVGTSFNAGASLSIQKDKVSQSKEKKSGKSRKSTSSVNLKLNVSYQRNSRKGHKIDKTYHMGVRVKVGQEEMPEGMEKLLGILEDAIVSTPTETAY